MTIVRKVLADRPRRVRSISSVPGLYEYRDIVETFQGFKDMSFSRLGEALSLAVIRGAGGYIETPEVEACVKHLMAPPQTGNGQTFFFQLETIRRVLEGSLIIRRGPHTATKKQVFLLLEPDGN